MRVGRNSLAAVCDMDRRRMLGALGITPLLTLGVHARASMSPDAIERRLRLALTFINPHDRPLVNQQFWCYLPANLAPRQRLSAIQVSAAHQLMEDELGHRILGLSFEHLPAHARKVVGITADVMLAAATSPASGDNVDDWLSAERLIESDQLHVRTLAFELRRDTPSETARAIYEWVRRNIGYAGYIRESLGAAHALRTLSGDCTEYAALVVALARANRIPARLVGGYVTDRNFVPRPDDYHDWAELYLDGTWRVVDAQKGNWLTAENQYVVFRIYRDAAINAVGHASRYRMEGEMQVRF